MKTKTTRASRGFTLLELVIVLVILGTIMAFVGPKIFQQMGKANSATAKIMIQDVAGKLELFRLEVGRYPTAQEGLQALVKQPPGVDKWAGPYLKDTDLKDPWGNDFKYNQPGNGKPYDLISLGADNQPGGEGENRDITN
jgi:general secretion pathway protein G